MTNETENPITTVTEPAVMSPKIRFVRTVLQAVVAFLVGVPVAVALVPNLDKDTSAAIVGIAAALVVLFSGLQNFLNKLQGEKAPAIAVDGHISAEPTEEGSTIRLNVDPADLVGKSYITLKVGNPPIG